MNHKNLAAFTACGSIYPAYVSVNEKDGEVSISVRSKAKENGSCGDMVEIVLSSDDFVKLYNELIEKMP